MNQLDAVSMREAVEGGIEIPALIQLRLIAGVVQHRVHAVVVGEDEVVDLELDRERPSRSVGAHLDGAAVAARLPDTIDVDLDPDGLVLVGPDTNREAAAPGAGVLRHELHGLPSGRIGGGSSRSPPIYPPRGRRAGGGGVVYAPNLGLAGGGIRRVRRGGGAPD